MLFRSHIFLLYCTYSYWDVLTGKQFLSSKDSVEADSLWSTETCVLGFPVRYNIFLSHIFCDVVIYLFVYVFVNLFDFFPNFLFFYLLFYFHLFFYLFIFSFVYLFFNLFSYLFVHLFTYSFTYLFIYLFIYQLINFFNYLFVYLFICLFNIFFSQVMGIWPPDADGTDINALDVLTSKDLVKNIHILSKEILS